MTPALRILAALALAAPAGCSPASTAHLAAPASPGATVPPSRYASVTAGAQTFVPVEPRGWEDSNRAVAPTVPRR